MAYTEAQKKATYRWRQKNLEYVNEKRKAFNQTYIKKNIEKYRIAANKYYYLKKELRVFMNILL